MEKRNFSVLREIISPENVQYMAELITIKQTKTLIGYIGNDAIEAHEKVYIDVMHKDDERYVLSDYYDLVQDVALFLCEHFGKYLDDYLYTSKKGRAVTVKMECYYIIKRELYRRYYVNGKNTSLDAFRYVKDNRDLTYRTEETEASYDRVEKIISLMNLGEKHLIVLNGRMNGISNSQLAVILQCTIGGVHGFRNVMKKRYAKVMRKYFG
ncbi:MAG: phosphoribosyltransferase family protein [Roseburia sp.]|nr:phosphoribosyltransferase family protein [Roseburia sp.]